MTKKMIDCSIAKNYFNEKQRMTKKPKRQVCQLDCDDCPLYTKNNGTGLSCESFEMHYPEQATEAVQRWSDEHPQRTYLTEFLKHYPNALLKDDGTPEICLSSLGLTNYNGCRNGITCSECWNQIIEGGEE